MQSNEERKQILIAELSYIVDLGSTSTEIYDNLQALLEVLRVQEVLDNDSYDQAEETVSRIWGFNTGKE